MHKTVVNYLILLCLVPILITGCGGTKEMSEVPKKEIDFTVCHDENLPKELKELVEQKKEKPFKFSYSTKEYTYITVGYGEQTMGGYSIQVKALYEMDNMVVIETSLKGPNPSEEKRGVSYPYIVVKIKNMDKTISFR